ncbi:MAG: hypothetical protein OXC06_07135 [Acidimicrobiaceae bacterium]|nr:hypothetical protein [Acidimicrobiaceae bacterium]
MATDVILPEWGPTTDGVTTVAWCGDEDGHMVEGVSRTRHPPRTPPRHQTQAE